MQSDEVKQFYNNFLKSRMINYRINNGSERINLASSFILKNINCNDNILEIGCGIGIITERISKKLKDGFIWACDISEQNIWYSKQTIRSKNIDFFEADILSQFDDVKKRINNKIDVFIFVDVLEHIPKEQHLYLLNHLNSISSANAKILITFPSEYYQEYLVRNNPNELQIIDERITIEYLSNLAKRNDLVIKYFELQDVWMNDQYVHAILSFKKPIIELQIKSRNIPLTKILNRFLRYYRKNKYINKIFNK